MPLEFPKADDLRIVRSLCHFLFDSHQQRASVKSVTTWLGETAEELFGREWRRTRTYHYTSASYEFGLISKPDSHVFNLTKLGRTLVRCNPQLATPDEPLNKKEKKIFVKILPNCDAVSRLLALYMPSGQPPKSLEDFVECGQPVRMVRSTSDSFLLISANQQKHEIDRTEKGTFAWTLHNWLRCLELVDDVYEENSASYLFQDRTVRIFYPIRIGRLSVKELRELLIAEGRKRSDFISGFFIPELLATVCATRGIPKVEFLKTLVDLNDEDPINFHLEMMSKLRGDPRGPAYYKYLNFPEVRGVRRSHVCISPNILRIEKS
jgi:hypothetical protein